MANYLIKYFMNLICSIYVLKNARLFSSLLQRPQSTRPLGLPENAPFRKLGDRPPTPTPSQAISLPPPPGSPVSRRREHGD